MPPLLVIIYYFLSLSSFQNERIYFKILLFLLSAIGFGFAGYLLNDWGDIEENRRQERENIMNPLSPSVRAILVLGTLIIAVGCWYFLLFDKTVLTLLGIQLLCYLIYSFPPLRLKERGVLGLLLDATYAHVLPAVLAIYTFSQLLQVNISIGTAGWALVLFYFVIVGVRNIIVHQQEDYEDDKKAGTNTFVVSVGLNKSRLIKNRLLVPIEIIAMLALYAVLPGLKVLAPAFILYAVYVFYREAARLRYKLTNGEKIDYGRYDFLSRVLLNEFYEKWQPLIFLTVYMGTIPLFRTIIVFHLLVFMLNTFRFKMDFWFLFISIALPIKNGIKFIYHSGFLKVLTLIYYNLKHIVYWNFYMPIKRGFGQHE